MIKMAFVSIIGWVLEMLIILTFGCLEFSKVALK